MQDTVKIFTYITKYYPYLLSKIKSLRKLIRQIGKLINSFLVSWNESRLKRSENMIIMEMIVNVFKNSFFQIPSQMCIKEKQVDSLI